MRKRMFTFGLVSWLGLVSWFCMLFFVCPTMAENQHGVFPSVSIADTGYDFGVIGEGIEARHDFVFVNRGGTALRLEPIQLS